MDLHIKMFYQQIFYFMRTAIDFEEDFNIMEFKLWFKNKSSVEKCTKNYENDQIDECSETDEDLNKIDINQDDENDIMNTGHGSNVAENGNDGPYPIEFPAIFDNLKLEKVEVKIEYYDNATSLDFDKFCKNFNINELIDLIKQLINNIEINQNICACYYNCIEESITMVTFDLILYRQIADKHLENIEENNQPLDKSSKLTNTDLNKTNINQNVSNVAENGKGSVKFQSEFDIKIKNILVSTGCRGFHYKPDRPICSFMEFIDLIKVGIFDNHEDANHKIPINFSYIKSRKPDGRLYAQMASDINEIIENNFTTNLEFNTFIHIKGKNIPEQDRILKIVMLMVSVGFCLFDVYSDIFLGIKYFIDEQILYGCLTFVFIFIPSFINTYIFYRNYGKSKNKNNLEHKLAQTKWPLFFLFFFQISTFVVAVKNLYSFIKKSIDRQSYELKNNNLLLMQINECLLEAAPQLTLNIVIIISSIGQETQDSSFLNIQRWITMAVSFVMIAKIAHAFQQIDWTSTDNEKRLVNLKPTEKIFFYFQILLLIVSRIIIISMSFISLPIFGLVNIFIHCIALILYNLIIVHKKMSNELVPILFEIYTFGILNIYHLYTDSYPFPLNKDTRYEFLFYYIFCLFESVIVVIIWFFKMDVGNLGDILYYALPSFGIAIFVLSIVFMIICNMFAKIDKPEVSDNDNTNNKKENNEEKKLLVPDVAEISKQSNVLLGDIFPSA